MILRYINSIFTFTCQHVHKSISVDNFLLLTQFCYHLMWLQNLENCSWKLWVNYWRRLHCWTFQRWLIVHLALRLSAVKLCSDVMTCSQTSSGWSEIIKPIMCLWSIGGGVILIHSLFSLANLFCMLARKLPEVGTFWNNWCFVRLMPFLLPYQRYQTRNSAISFLYSMLQFYWALLPLNRWNFAAELPAFLQVSENWKKSGNFSCEGKVGKIFFFGKVREN